MCVPRFLSSVAALLTCRSMGTATGRYIGQPLNEVNPIRRDTFLIPAYNWMIIRFTTDNRAYRCLVARRC